MTIVDVEFHNCMGSAIIVLSGSGSVEVTSCVFVNNRAISNGGAIYSKSYSLTVASSIFSNNSATGLGGAIYAELQELSVSSSTFYMNSASSGAGIYGLNIGTPGNTMVIFLPLSLSLPLVATNLLSVLPPQQLHQQHSRRERRSLLRRQLRLRRQDVRLHLIQVR